MAQPPKVVFPLYEGSTLLDFAGATQVFATAGFAPVWAAASLDPITTTENVQVLPGDTFDGVRQKGAVEVLFVPGGATKVGEVMQDATTINFLCDVGRQARYAGSVCTGAFIVAAAGLFDGCEVTTYWNQRDNLALFPNLRVAAGYPRWVISGNRFSGGGISSSIDLALELVNLICGPTQSMSTQLADQYAPGPPHTSGDPSQAPPEITASARAAQEDFAATIRQAVEKVLEKS
ncbi:MAG: DJ-1/PfpI family protein [Actinomycetota bacterium]|nr:DJ-1/PfpI family protein [Actinomycetota bacterium]